MIPHKHAIIKKVHDFIFDFCNLKYVIIKYVGSWIRFNSGYYRSPKIIKPISIYVEQLNEPPFDVPDMFSKPGTPCNNYKGYCDVFQKCRQVNFRRQIFWSTVFLVWKSKAHLVKLRRSNLLRITFLELSLKTNWIFTISFFTAFREFR